jgi:hypothetical protein
MTTTQKLEMDLLMMLETGAIDSCGVTTRHKEAVLALAGSLWAGMKPVVQKLLSDILFMLPLIWLLLYYWLGIFIRLIH